MPVTWVRVRHKAHGGETTVPAKSLPAARRRGFLPVDTDEPEGATEAAAPITSQSAETPPDEPSESGRFTLRKKER